MTILTVVIKKKKKKKQESLHWDMKKGKQTKQIKNNISKFYIGLFKNLM
jgi:hypothetical protein